jgi:hypothetical protein
MHWGGTQQGQASKAVFDFPFSRQTLYHTSLYYRHQYNSSREGINLGHKHDIKKTHLCFIEFDDVNHTKLAKDKTYFGEKNSKERVLEFDFEYCLGCGLRWLDGKPIMTRDILEEEFERLVAKAKNNQFTSSEQTTLQHTDFETFERLIKSALEFGRLREESGTLG